MPINCKETQREKQMIYLIDRIGDNNGTLEQIILTAIAEELYEKLKTVDGDYIICLDNSYRSIYCDRKISLYDITDREHDIRAHNILSEAKHNRNPFVMGQLFNITNNSHIVAVIHVIKQSVRVFSKSNDELSIDLTDHAFMQGVLSEVQTALYMHNCMKEHTTATQHQIEDNNHGIPHRQTQKQK